MFVGVKVPKFAGGAQSRICGYNLLLGWKRENQGFLASNCPVATLDGMMAEQQTTRRARLLSRDHGPIFW